MLSVPLTSLYKNGSIVLNKRLLEMSKLLYKCYDMYKLFFKRLYNYYSFVSFIVYLLKINAFTSEDPKVSLLVLSKFLGSNSINYPDNLIMGRNVLTSNLLFSNLVNLYLENNSEVQLDQALCVYKEDFIRREESGRK